MRQPLTLLALLAVLAGCPSALRAAPEEPWGQPVVSVTLDVEGVPTIEPGLRDLVEVRVGAPLDARRVRESITHLFSLGRFDDVVVRYGAGTWGDCGPVCAAAQPLGAQDRIHGITRPR